MNYINQYIIYIHKAQNTGLYIALAIPQQQLKQM